MTQTVKIKNEVEQLQEQLDFRDEAYKELENRHEVMCRAKDEVINAYSKKITVLEHQLQHKNHLENVIENFKETLKQELINHAYTRGMLHSYQMREGVLPTNYNGEETIKASTATGYVPYGRR